MTLREILGLEFPFIQGGMANIATGEFAAAASNAGGLGIIGRKPDIKYRMTREGCRELSELQREILSVVWEYVKPGGILIYSTCTISRAENQENMEWLLREFPFETVDISQSVGTVFQEETAKKGYLQLLPGRHPSDGFFLTVLKRKQQ